jgi:MFS family permease
MPEMAEVMSLWRDRTYVCYRISRAVSMFGSRISGIAGPLLVLSMGGGPIRAGAVGSCALLARMVFQLPGGQLADRFDQRRLMVAMDAMRLVAVGSIPLAALLHVLTFSQLMVVALIEGAASAVFGATAMVFLRVLVSRGLFSRAMSQSMAQQGATALLGPVVGGALFGVDPILPFVADAASYLVGGLLLLAISVRGHRSADGSPDTGDQTDQRVTAGLRWLRGRPALLRITLSCSVINLISAATSMATVVVMDDHGTPASVIGVVMACGGTGMFFGALLATRIIAAFKGWLYLVTGLAWAASLATLAASSAPWAVGVVLTFLALLSPSSGVLFFQLLRDEVPKDLYGRVIAAQQLLGVGVAVAGPLLAGVLVAAFGGTYLWLVLAGGCLLAAVLTIRPLPNSPAPGAPAPAAGPAQPAAARLGG